MLTALAARTQQFNFIQLSVEDGLPQTQVFDICADNQGYLWFGTAGGAAKYDGKTFTRTEELYENSQSFVFSIKRHHGFVWLASKNSITRIRQKNAMQFDLTFLTGDYSISDITFSKGSIWVAVQYVGIYEIPLSNDEIQLEKATLHEPVKNLKSRVVFADANDRIWVGGKGFLGYYENEIWKPYLAINNDNISDIDEDIYGTLWISTYQNGVFAVKDSTITNYSTADGLASNLIRTLFIDKDNKVWVTSKNGVSYISDTRIKTFNQKNGLDNDNIKVVGQDIEGNIWLGTDGSGAYRFTGESMVYFSKEDGLSSNYIMSITDGIDNKNDSIDVWLSTYGGGITHLTDTKTEVFTTENSIIPNNTVWSTHKDRNNNIWFGSSYGLIKRSHNKFEVFIDEDWLPSNKILAIHETPKGEIYFGSSRGLAKYKNGTFSAIRPRDTTITLMNIRTIEEINENLWLGTSYGIIVYHPKINTFTNWDFNTKIEGLNVYAIEETPFGVFIGTEKGLFKYKDDNLLKIELSNSFSANYINFITFEKEGYLWVGTNFGIFEIDLKEYEQNPKKAIQHFSPSNGLKSSETNLNAAFVDNNKRVWMGTGDGLLLFERNKKIVSKKIAVPEIEIEDVQLYLKPTNWKKYADTINPYTKLPRSLNLNFKKNYLSFFFKAISITNPDELRYKIKLEGFDEEWSPELKQTNFSYTNLPYGNYSFLVKASTDGMNWSQPASFDFTINIPYYLTWWFITLFILAALLILFFFIKYLQNVEKRKRATQQILYKNRLLALEQQTLNSSMNRHFIFNALNSIQYYINSSDRKSANKYLTSFAKLIRKNLDSSSSGNSLVSLSEEVERLELYISLEHMRFQNKFGYEIKIEPNIDTENIQVPPMFLQPFVENSIWHGILPMEKPGKISVRVYTNSKGQLQIDIEDNGIGIEESKKNKGTHSHQSKGMLITSGRIDVLRKVTNQHFVINGPFELIEEGKTIGTKVEIIREK